LEIILGLFLILLGAALVLPSVFDDKVQSGKPTVDISWKPPKKGRYNR